MRAMAADGDSVARQDQTSDLQLLVHSAPSMIHAAGPDGCLDFFNQTWLTYVGWPLRICRDGSGQLSSIPEDVEGIVERWRDFLASGEPFLHEARVLRADGAYRWMLLDKVATQR
jgi:PAS domain-containing protein